MLRCAVEAGVNRLETGSLGFTDLANHDHYRADAYGFDLSLSFTPAQPATATRQGSDSHLTPGGSAGFAREAGSREGLTLAAASGGEILIRDEAAQIARTGQSAADVLGALPREAEAANRGALVRAWDGERLLDQVQGQAEVVQIFSREASQAWGHYANERQREAALAADAEATECWGASGTCRAAGHVLIGGLAGGAPGALGAGAASLGASHVHAMLSEAGFGPSGADILTAVLTTGMGAAVGGTVGAITAFNEVNNNFLTSYEVNTLLHGIAHCGSDNDCRLDLLANARALSESRAPHVHMLLDESLLANVQLGSEWLDAARTDFASYGMISSLGLSGLLSLNMDHARIGSTYPVLTAFVPGGTARDGAWHFQQAANLSEGLLIGGFVGGASIGANALGRIAAPALHGAGTTTQTLAHAVRTEAQLLQFGYRYYVVPSATSASFWLANPTNQALVVDFVQGLMVEGHPNLPLTTGARLGWAVRFLYEESKTGTTKNR